MEWACGHNWAHGVFEGRQQDCLPYADRFFAQGHPEFVSAVGHRLALDEPEIQTMLGVLGYCSKASRHAVRQQVRNGNNHPCTSSDGSLAWLFYVNRTS